ncbi:MAG: hypothetical protein EXR70_20835 [Deltaproteobacteria bacterium]|nr:hypothetical protein [Deltaproteobacteria bacterium]
MSLKFLSANLLFAGLSLILLVPALAADSLNIYFKTAPVIEQVRPFADPVNLSVLVTGADGRPVTGGIVELRLDAPPAGSWLSTDIPLVEGTRLLELRLPLRQGRANWKYLMPIRGRYRLVVDAISEDGRRHSQTFEFTVSENRYKWIALSGFSLALLLFGFAAGRVFTSAKVASAVLLVVCLGGVEAALAAADYSAHLDIEAATVGKPSRVHWRLEGGGENPRAALTLSITHLEKDKIVFAVERLAVAGEFEFKYHFPDGAEYRVTAVAEVPGRGLVNVEKNISVTGVEPPATAMIPALSFFLALVALGLVAGRWSKRRGTKK